ncbi:hypothetical protein [[Eubacterium] cellulosolvens]
MTENTILLKARAWGCKIKSEIQAELKLATPELKQGDDLNLKLSLNFAPEDLPKSFTIAQEEKQTPGYILAEPVQHEVTGAEVDLDLPIRYTDAKPGEYRIEINLRHGEYGTLLAEVLPITFKLKTPDVDIVYCRADKSSVSRGQEFGVQVGIYSPAPQKLRGIVYGRLISTSELVHKLYELEPKRISIIGEREVKWHLQIPADESKTGKLNGVIEFKSKDTFSKKDFEGLLEIRIPRSLRVNSITSSASKVSGGDELELVAELENIGLEDLDIEAYPEIRCRDPIASPEKHRESTMGLSLEPKKLQLVSDKNERLKWSWDVPKDFSTGKYLVNLHWKDLKTSRTDMYGQELFEVTKYHEVKIFDAEPELESFGVAQDAVVKLKISDTGTRVTDELNVNYQVFDILNQEIYQSSGPIRVAEDITEYNFHWPIPSNQDSGRYDLQVKVILGDQELASRRFSKIINIELPVKLDIHLMLPRPKKEDLTMIPYLLETEKIVKRIKHGNLLIYRLNSNTHLFKIDDELIKYSKYGKSSPEKLRAFGDGLLSYLVTQMYLNTKTLKSEMDYWVEVGYTWSNMLMAGEKFIAGKELKELKKLSHKPPKAALWNEIAKIIRKTTGYQTGNRSTPAQLKNIFKIDLFDDKSLVSTEDFKLITIILDSLIGIDLKSSKIGFKPQTKLAVKSAKNNIGLLNELTKILENSLKFRTNVNSNLLQKKFNRVLSNWLIGVRKGRINHKPNVKKWLAIRTVYSYLFLRFIQAIYDILKTVARENYIAPNKFRKLVLLQNLYYYSLMNYNHTQAKFDPYLASASISEQLNFAYNELKKFNNTYWDLHKTWQTRCSNYLKNMTKRGNLAYVNEHIKITANPVILRGLRGTLSRTKLILGNNGSHSITLQPYLALPSIHWNLVEPEATTINNVYNLKRVVISPKQTKELPIIISFPQSLSFPNYTGILKLTAKPIELRSEID